MPGTYPTAGTDRLPLPQVALVGRRTQAALFPQRQGIPAFVCRAGFGGSQPPPSNYGYTRNGHLVTHVTAQPANYLREVSHQTKVGPPPGDQEAGRALGQTPQHVSRFP